MILLPLRDQPVGAMDGIDFCLPGAKDLLRGGVLFGIDYVYLHWKLVLSVGSSTNLLPVSSHKLQP